MVWKQISDIMLTGDCSVVTGVEVKRSVVADNIVKAIAHLIEFKKYELWPVHFIIYLK